MNCYHRHVWLETATRGLMPEHPRFECRWIDRWMDGWIDGLGGVWILLQNASQSAADGRNLSIRITICREFNFRGLRACTSHIVTWACHQPTNSSVHRIRTAERPTESRIVEGIKRKRKRKENSSQEQEVYLPPQMAIPTSWMTYSRMNSIRIPEAPQPSNPKQQNQPYSVPVGPVSRDYLTTIDVNYSI